MDNPTEYSRIILKRSTIAGEEPTINTATTIDNTWLTTDILIGEVFINAESDKYYYRTNNGIVQLANLADITGLTPSNVFSASTGLSSIVTTSGASTASGLFSIALNGENIASGDSSTATGIATIAGGEASFSSGEQTQAIGKDSFATGFQTQAIGYYSASFGNSNIANGQYSFVGGAGSKANGSSSFVFGLDSATSGTSTFILGTNITGNTDYTLYVNNLNINDVVSGTSVSYLGIDSNNKVIKAPIPVFTDTYITGGTVSNTGSTVTFTNNTGGTFSVTGFTEGLWSAGTNTNSILMPSSLNYASGERSLSIGFGSNASGLRSFAGGTSSNASGQMGFAFGLNATAGGYTSLAFGYGVQASNDYTIAMGYNTFASGGNSVSIGGGNSASGYRSFALGYNNISNNDFGYCIGTDGNTFSIIGRKTYSNGKIASIGDCQSSELILKALTTGSTSTTATTNNTTASSTNQLVLQNNQLIRFKGSVIAKQSGTTDVGIWDIDGSIVRGATASATTLVTSSVTTISNGASFGTPTLNANTVIGGLQVLVSGLASTNIRWVIRIETEEVIY